MWIDPNSVNFGITSFPCEHFMFNEKEKRRNKLIFSESTMVSVKSLFLFSNCDFSINDDETAILLENNTTNIYTGDRQVRFPLNIEWMWWKLIIKQKLKKTIKCVFPLN